MPDNMREWLKKIPLIHFIGRKINEALEWRVEQKRRYHLKKSGHVVANLVHQALQDLDGIYFITFGSLLGLVRNGKFMSYDNDLDYGVIVKDGTEMEAIKQRLVAAGFVLERYFEMDEQVMEITLSYNGLGVDFFGYFIEPSGDHMTAYIYHRLPEVKYADRSQFSVFRSTTRLIDGVHTVTYDSMEVQVPINAEAYLSDVYTEDWRMPDPNWVSTKSKCYFAVPDKTATEHK